MRTTHDFPFYNGHPVAISAGGWLLVLAAVGLGFAALIWPVPMFAAFPLNLIQTGLFVALPLGALALVAGRDWTALFHRYGVREFALSVGFAALTLVVSFSIALVLSTFMTFTANPAAGQIAGGDTLAFVAFLARTVIQLLGEELVTILPLLAVLWLCVDRLKLSRTTGIVIAVIVSTLWFGALHLPTYNWNIVQCFAIIGTARIVLTLSYLVTRNIWVSTGAHIINDWAGFFLTFVGSHTPIDAGV